jgi:hypothetical protein
MSRLVAASDFQMPKIEHERTGFPQRAEGSIDRCQCGVADSSSALAVRSRAAVTERLGVAWACKAAASSAAAAARIDGSKSTLSATPVWIAPGSRWMTRR